MSLDAEANHRFLSQCIDLWVKPELRRRGKSTDHIERVLKKALIIFDAAKRENMQVLLDEEVGAVAEFKLKEGATLPEIGGTISADQIERVEFISPEPPVDSNRAFIFVMRMGTRWILAMDARYNLGRVNRILDDAGQFLNAAELALSANLVKPFLDLLFSAAELLAKCELLIIPVEFNQVRREKHAKIAVEIRKHPLLDRTFTEFRDTFNKLSGRRPSARYGKGDLRVSSEQCSAFLLAVQKEYEYLRDRAVPRRQWKDKSGVQQAGAISED